MFLTRGYVTNVDTLDDVKLNETGNCRFIKIVHSDLNSSGKTLFMPTLLVLGAILCNTSSKVEGGIVETSIISLRNDLY